jgi:hypothetical protein
VSRKKHYAKIKQHLHKKFEAGAITSDELRDLVLIAADDPDVDGGAKAEELVWKDSSGLEEAVAYAEAAILDKKKKKKKARKRGRG